MIPEGAVAALHRRVKLLQSGESTGHDWHHTHRVYTLALEIAANEPLDVDGQVLQVAALLHDYVDHKFVPSAAERTDRLLTILGENGIEGPIARDLVRIIESISFSKNKDKAPPEDAVVRIIQDADRLDALGAIGIARTFAYGGKVGRPIFSEEQGAQHSIGHFYEKLLLLKSMMHTEHAKRIAADRHAFLLTFLERFHIEFFGADRGREEFEKRGFR